MIHNKTAGVSGNFSYGQIAVTTLKSSNQTITQGFLQPSVKLKFQIKVNESKEICLGDSVVLSSSGGESYEWTDALDIESVMSTDSFLLVRPRINSTYTLLIDSIHLLTESILIKNPENCPLSLIVYELLSPNMDGDNDVFFIENIDLVTDHEVYVYDKWGKQIFYSDDYLNDWSAQGIRDGVYVYLVEDKDRHVNYKGKLLIKR